jgi:hypothetical protein
MMEKPTIITLSAQTKTFMEVHFKQFLDCIKIIFPLVLVAAFLKQLPKDESPIWINYGLVFITLCLHAFLCLQWSRVCLSGSSREIPKQNAIRFVVGFILLAGLLGGFIWGLEQLSVMHLFEKKIGIAVLIAKLAATAIGIILFLRASLFLTAQADGKNISFPAAFALSRGVTWPLFGSTVLWWLLFIVALSVYTLVVMLIIKMSDSGTPLKAEIAIGIGFVVTVPIHFAILLFNAIVTATIARCYQWGLQKS